MKKARESAFFTLNWTSGHWARLPRFIWTFHAHFVHIDLAMAGTLVKVGLKRIGVAHNLQVVGSNPSSVFSEAPWIAGQSFLGRPRDPNFTQSSFEEGHNMNCKSRGFSLSASIAQRPPLSTSSTLVPTWRPIWKRSGKMIAGNSIHAYAPTQLTASRHCSAAAARPAHNGELPLPVKPCRASPQ